jgi:predicted secreted protein
MNVMRKPGLALLSGMLVCATAGAGTTVDLTAEASRPAANDMVRATVFAEASGSNPAELARRVNQDIAEGLKVIKARPASRSRAVARAPSRSMRRTRKSKAGASTRN